MPKNPGHLRWSFFVFCFWTTVLSLWYLTFVYFLSGKGHCSTCVWRLEDNLPMSVLPLHGMGSTDCTHFISMASSFTRGLLIRFMGPASISSCGVSLNSNQKAIGYPHSILRYHTHGHSPRSLLWFSGFTALWDFPSGLHSTLQCCESQPVVRKLPGQCQFDFPMLETPMCSVLGNRTLPSSSGGQPWAVATACIVLGVSGTPLTNAWHWDFYLATYDFWDEGDPCNFN